MPTLKYSTSIDEGFKRVASMKAVDQDYKWLLDQLLALIHRDGGQYTTLVGYADSVNDAIDKVVSTRKELSMRLHRKDG